MEEDIFASKTKYKLITKDITGETPVGYCYYQKHRGYISKQIMKTKGCNKKCCRYFCKNMNHPWWQRKERIKVMKIAEKQGCRFYVFEGKTYLASEKI